jgi:hypothetical protein
MTASSCLARLKARGTNRHCERSEAILYVEIALGFRIQREGGRGA